MPATKGSNISCSSHRTSRKAASIAAQNATCPRKLTWHLRLRAWHRAGRLLHLSPRAGRGRFASGALAKRSKSGEGALPQAQTRGQAPSPGFLRSAALRLESDLSPHAGRGGASCASELNHSGGGRMTDKIAIADTDLLLVIDVQNDFCPGGKLAVPRGDEVVPLVNRLAEKFSHVVLTQDWHPPGHLSFASSHAGKKPFETITVTYG